MLFGRQVYVKAIKQGKKIYIDPNPVATPVRRKFFTVGLTVGAVTVTGVVLAGLLAGWLGWPSAGPSAEPPSTTTPPSPVRYIAQAATFEETSDGQRRAAGFAAELRAEGLEPVNVLHSSKYLGLKPGKVVVYVGFFPHNPDGAAKVGAALQRLPDGAVLREIRSRTVAEQL